MALTFAAEMILLMYVLAKYSISFVEYRLIVLILLLLALFQLSEYGICESFVFNDIVWAKIGFFAITFLPSLGLHLIQKVRKDPTISYSLFGYFLSVIFVVIFVFFNTFNAVGCQGNYAFFELTNGIGGAFFIYYYALLVLGATLALLRWKQAKQANQGKTLLVITLGYASFIMPGTIIHFAFNQVSNGLPSIMCGFALIFAIILTFWVSDGVGRTKP
jgi:hypothetical protein